MIKVASVGVVLTIKVDSAWVMVVIKNYESAGMVLVLVIQGGSAGVMV